MDKVNNIDIVDLVDSPTSKPSKLSPANTPTIKTLGTLRITNFKCSKMIESDAKLPPLRTKVMPQSTQTGKRKYVDESDQSSSETDPEEDNVLVTCNVPPPAQRITHPNTGAVYENITPIIYKRAKEEKLHSIWYGWTVPPAQHAKFMAPNETFVIFSRSDTDNEMHRFSYRSEPGEFARIGFYKKISPGNPKK